MALLGSTEWWQEAIRLKLGSTEWWQEAIRSNDLDVKAADIHNTYLTAPVSEKIGTRLVPEFGSDVGKIAIIVRALYGLHARIGR